MDIWGSIYIGKRWVEDDGSTKVKIQNTKEWHVSRAPDMTVQRTGNFKIYFAGMTMEVARIVEEQLDRMRDELLHAAEQAIGTKEAKDAENQDTETDQGE